MSWYDANLVLVQGTITGLLLALSVQVPLRMGVFSFAGVGAYGIGCYSGAIFVLDLGLGGLPTVLLSSAVGALVLLGLGLLVFRLRGLYLAMATAAFDLIIGVVALNGGDLTGGSTGRYGVITGFTMVHMWSVCLVALVAVGLTERGRIGRRIEVVREDPELAMSIGVNIRRYRLAAFAASGALGAAAGSMNVLVRSVVSPGDIGFPLVVLALTMIIVGGALSWRGAVIGAVVFTWLPDLLQGVAQWRELAYGVIVALAAIFLPRGVYGLYVDGRRALIRRRRQRPVGAGDAGAHSTHPAVASAGVHDVRVQMEKR